MDQLSLRERNRQRTRQRILSAAFELFKSAGYHQTTIDDIAQKSEVSRRTLFNYFPSKEALLLPWAQEILDGHVYPRVIAYLETQPTTIECLRMLFSVFTETIQASPDVVQAFMRESLQSNDIPQKEMVGNGVHEIFLHVVRYGQTRGEVRTDIPAEHLASCLLALQAPLLFSLLESIPHPAMTLDLDTLLAFIKSGLRSEV